MKSIKKIILGVTALVATLCFISCKPEPEPESVTEVAKYYYSVSAITFYSDGAFVYEISSGSLSSKGKGTYSGDLSKNGEIKLNVTEIESSGQTVPNNDIIKLSATITENGETLNLRMNGVSVGKFTKNKDSDNSENNNSSNTNNPDNSDNTTVIIPDNSDNSNTDNSGNSDNSSEGVDFPVVYKLPSIKLTFFKDKTFTYEQTGITLNGTYSGDLSKNGEIKMNVKNTSTATTYKLAATISDNGETLNLTFTQIVYGMEASVPNTLIRQ